MSAGSGAASRRRAPPTACSLLSQLAEGSYDPRMLASERVQAAIVLVAGGDRRRLRDALDLAATDWRDLLVWAELADADWPARLDRALGPP